MRQRNWLGRALMTGMLAIPLVGVALFACGDDDAEPQATPDSGTDAPADTATDTNKPETSKPGAPPVISLLHAMNDLDSIRICFLVEGAFPLSTPLPEDGVGPGQGGRLPLAETFAAQVPLVKIRPVLIKAEALTPTDTCEGIFQPGSGVPESAVFNLPEIPAGTLKTDKTYVLAFLGCTANPDGGAGPNTAAKCGPGYTGASNLRTGIIEIDGTSTPTSGEIGLQFVHASPEATAFADAGVRAGIRFPDGGVIAIGSGVSFTTLPVPTPTSAVTVPGLLTSPDDTTVSLYRNNGGALGPATALGIDIPITNLAQFSSGEADAGYFQKNANYTIFAVGDPAQTNFETQPHAFRLMALKATK